MSTHRFRTPAMAATLLAASLVLLGVASFFLWASRNVPFPTPWGFRGYPGVMALPFALVGAPAAALPDAPPRALHGS